MQREFQTNALSAASSQGVQSNVWQTQRVLHP